MTILNFPAIAFEIPLEEFDGNRRSSATPPPHVQRLLEPPKSDISLPDIEEKLAEAEQRRREVSICTSIFIIFTSDTKRRELDGLNGSTVYATGLDLE